MQEVESQISSLIDRQDVCFISYVDANGYPSTRAMLNPRKRQGIKEFYLTTNTSSRKAQEFMRDAKAGLYFCDKKFYQGVAFTGTVEVLQEQAIKDEIWRDMDIIFYENNHDPDYCVLKFTAQTARYYNEYTSVDLDLS